MPLYAPPRPAPSCPTMTRLGPARSGHPTSARPPHLGPAAPARPAQPSRPAQAYPGRLAHHPSPPHPGPIHGRAAGLSSPSSAIDTRDMSTRSVLRRRFDVWRPKDLRAEGTSDRSRSRMIRSGDLISLGKGWYSSPGTPPEVAGPLSRGHRATCITAAEMHGLWVPASAKVHEVGLRRESETSESAVTWHRPIVRAWPDDEPIMPLRVALVHAAHCLPPWEAAALLESALERWQLGPDEVAEILRELPPTRRRALGRISTRAGSGSETRVRRHLERRGVRVREQVHVPEVGRADLIAGDRLIIECDSLAHHASVSGYHEDRRRDRMALKGGYLVLRLTWHDIWQDWSTACELLADLIGKRVHRGPLLRSTAPGAGA